MFICRSLNEQRMKYWCEGDEQIPQEEPQLRVRGEAIKNFTYVEAIDD